MDFEKYSKQILNYNILTKKNYITNNTIDKIILTEDNKHIISIYNLLLILLSIKLIFNKKSFIRKSKNSNLFTGLRKNENLGIKLTLRKKLKNKLMTNLLYFYNTHINISRNLSISYTSKIFTLKLKNINKIDNILLKEYALLKSLTYSINFINKTNNTYLDNLNIYLPLTHLGFSFTYYEK